MPEPDIIPPKGPPRASQQPALSGLRLRPGKHALSENPIIFAANQYAPLNLKRLIPRPLVEFIRRLLSPRTSSSSPPASAPSEVQRDPSFDWLGPFFGSVGLDGEPGAILSRLTCCGLSGLRDCRRRRTCGARSFARAACSTSSCIVRSFPISAQLDPALHYVIVGERMGFTPSAGFDPAYYNDRNPNLGRSCLLAHYVKHGRGRAAGRSASPQRSTIDTSRIDPKRETILVVSHEATRTGAPILAYNIVKRLSPQYNVVTVLLSGGNIVPAFAMVSASVVGPLQRKDWHPAEMDYLVRSLLQNFQFSYALVNSVDARQMMKPLSSSLCASRRPGSRICISPEAARRDGSMRSVWATEVVFSAERVFESVRAESPSHRTTIVFISCRRGRRNCRRARTKTARLSKQTSNPACGRPGHENDFVVLGCGTISPRKGVDLFLACALLP